MAFISARALAAHYCADRARAVASNASWHVGARTASRVMSPDRLLVLASDWGATAILHIHEAHEPDTDPAYHTFAAGVCARLAVHAAGKYLAAREAVA